LFTTRYAGAVGEFRFASFARVSYREKIGGTCE
jgi:hypothetical protein